MKKRRLLQALFYKAISNFCPVDLKKIYEIACMDMNGMLLDEVLKIGEECFQQEIKPRLYQEAIAKIQEHKRKGDLTYLVTSAPYMTVAHLAHFLQVDGYFSAGPVIDYTKNPVGILRREVQTPLYYREGKVIAAEEVSAKHKISLQNCYYYADSIDDVFLFEKVGHPCLVNPDSKIKKIAKQKNWPVLRFQKTLGDL